MKSGPTLKGWTRTPRREKAVNSPRQIVVFPAPLCGAAIMRRPTRSLHASLQRRKFSQGARARKAKATRKRPKREARFGREDKKLLSFPSVLTPRRTTEERRWGRSPDFRHVRLLRIFYLRRLPTRQRAVACCGFRSGYSGGGRAGFAPVFPAPPAYENC